MQTLRRLPMLLCALALAAAAGCASTTPLSAEKIALNSVTAARQSCTAALRAGKFTLAQDQTCQGRLDLTRVAIEAASAAGNAAQVAQGKATADAITADPTKGVTP